MTDDRTDPVLLARDIAHDLGRLTEHLLQAGPQQTALIVESIFDGEDSVLGRLTMLLASASHYTRAAEGTFSPELCLALGTASNSLDDIAFDLDAHTDELHRRATTSAVVRTGMLPAPASTAAASGPVRRGPS